MMKVLLITLFAIAIGSIAAQAQGSGTWAGVSQCWDASSRQWVTVQGNCPASSGGGGGGSSSNGYGLIGLPFQLIYALVNGIFGGGSNTNAADEAMRQQQEQLMMAEVRRRAEEAERLHQEEEARRLAAIYNRLAVTLKLSGLPHLELKTSGIPVGGLQLKLGDSATGANVASNQHVRGFNEGGVPGIQDIYNGGPSPFWPRDRRQLSRQPLRQDCNSRWATLAQRLQPRCPDLRYGHNRFQQDDAAAVGGRGRGFQQAAS